MENLFISNDEVIEIIDDSNSELANKLLKENKYEELKTKDTTIIGAINENLTVIQNKQNKNSHLLKTKSKDIVSAINELFDALNG